MNLNFVLLLLLTVSLVGAKKDAKIIGGRFAKRNEFPFVVALFSDLGSFCGGALVTLEKVLTAGHCVVVESGPFGNVVNTQFSVVGGSIKNNIRNPEPGMQHRRVRQVQLHPGYRVKKAGNSFHDIALCILVQSFDPSPSLKPMEWITNSVSKFKEAYFDVLQSDKSCIGVGWGVTDKAAPAISPTLKAIDLRPRYPRYCRRFSTARGDEDMTDKGEVCLSSYVEASGICSGDSGGPLICDGYVYGLLTSVVNECGIKAFPANYLLYWPYLDFFRLSDTTMSFSTSIFHQKCFFLYLLFSTLLLAK